MSTSTITDLIPVGTYSVDPAHSNVGFEVRHMGIATVRGSFHSFEGKLDATADAAVLAGTVAVDSVDTNEENRDGHLKAPEFFDAAQYPQISFTSTGGEPNGEGQIRLHGEITIKGITKPLELVGLDWGGRRGSLGQPADRSRARGKARSSRIRSQVEPDPPQRESAGLQ